MTGQVEGKIAIITGAASGMGAAVARLMYANGANLVLADLSDSVVQLAAELGDRAVGIAGDVGASADAVAMVDLAVTRFGGADILCNIAGYPGDNRGTLVDCSDENFDKLVAVNFRGPFMTMKAAIPHMIARGGGSIVNVASTAALKGYPSLVVYGGSKAGLVALSRGAATEFAAQNIRVNTICPGPHETPMLLAAIEANPASRETIIANVPMRRLGKPEEIAQAIYFYASDASAFVTGTVLPVEGGQTA
ncbi:3-oxoacyl-ACP reductase [Sphingobium sp. SCG-1]|nr:3-oxoacyl-ACP reductase [Sphingobium sp. SCG-1]